MDASYDWVIVAALGAAVGLAELVSRYRDEPLKALLTIPGALYLVLNGAAAVLALLLIRAFGWTFGSDTGGEATRWWQVLVAGLGTMALFRSAFFKVRVGDQDVAVGPSSVLDVVLAATDRGVDRLRARARSTAAAAVMRDISF